MIIDYSRVISQIGLLLAAPLWGIMAWLFQSGVLYYVGVVGLCVCIIAFCISILLEVLGK